MIAGGTWGQFEPEGLGYFAEQHLSNIRAGDYIWIDAFDDSNNGTAHGLIVVGWQSPMKCDDVVSTNNNAVFSPSTLYISHSEADNHGLDFSVPYVSDYTTAQSPMPRPFYCTHWIQTESPPPGQDQVKFFFDHDYRFYRMPDLIELPAQSLFVNSNWQWGE